MKIFHFLLTGLLVTNFLQAHAQCAVSGSHYTASYPTGWNVTDMGDAGESYACNDGHNGTIYVDGTAAYFFSARGGRELRASTAIPAVSNNNWTMDFTLIINPSFFPTTLLPTNSPAVVLAALTSDQMSLQSSCAGGSLCTPCGSYANTNMDAMWVYLTSNAPNGCADSQTGKAWRIVAAARDGSGAQNNSTAINIPTGVAGTYYIRFQRTTNQAVVSVYTNSNYTGHVSGSPQCLSIPGSVTDLDVLSHEVMAQETCTRTFNGIVDHLKIDNSLPCTLPLNASFYMPDYNCHNEPFIVNGSSSTTSNVPISHHLWVVEECNASGSSWWGPVWFGPAIPGAPSGNYSINPTTVNAGGGPNMQIGHYYRVSLILASCSNPWSSASKVIQIGAIPNINMNASSTVAHFSNNQYWANIHATATGGSGSYTVNIYKFGFPPAGNSFTVYSGPPFPCQFTQNITTTYYIEVTDNVTGCSKRVTRTVSMPFSAAFTVNTTAVSSDQFSLETHPVDGNLNSYEDFTYSHVIQELAQDGTPLYTHTSSDCWTNYPNPESFKGFTSTGTATYTQESSPNCGDPGRFIPEHRYRITTIMQATSMDEQQYSVVVSVDKSGQLLVEEDKNAPNLSHLPGQATAATDNIVISPNPSTGIFTIELEEGTDAALIEVTNALGQKVKSFEAKGTRSELDLTGFTKGIYLVTVTSNGNSTTQKIVLE